MKKILIVDDIQEILKFFSEALQRKGYQVFCVSDGFSAVNCALREDPDLILLDISMPKINGIEVALMLRKMLSHYIPIIALSGTDHSEACKEAGFDHFALKPMPLNELYAMVNHYTTLWGGNQENEQTGS